MSTPANFNGARPVIDVNDTAMLLIDHQSGLFQTVGDMPMPELRARAAALAKMASLAGIPVITTASVPQGPNGPLIPEIHENAPHAKYIARKGEINAWDNPEFVAAVKATGRKTLIIAGTITSVCMAFPAIAAVADGYKVFAVIDASGTYSKMAQEITLARVVQAGVVPMDTAAVASELQRTWNRPDAAEWAEVYTVPQGPNGPLIPEIHENAPHAQYIARKGEINAWDNPEFVAAVKATGRKTLIIAGTITSVCMAFPAIAAVADGYKVFAVIDASGTYSKMAQEITLARVVQAGVVPMDTAAVASELQRTWNRPDAAEWAEVYTKVFPAYQLLIESYSKAQDVVKNNEQLDSQR